MALPPALFICGTIDCLLDDNIFMSAKWLMSGSEAILKLYPGMCVRERKLCITRTSTDHASGGVHGFTNFPATATEESGKAFADATAFINAKLS